MLIYTSRCTCCPVEHLGPLTLVGADAQVHEQQSGHRVQVLDGPSSLVPREWWTDRPAPVLAPVVEVAA